MHPASPLPVPASLIRAVVWIAWLFSTAEPDVILIACASDGDRDRATATATPAARMQCRGRRTGPPSPSPHPQDLAELPTPPGPGEGSEARPDPAETDGSSAALMGNPPDTGRIFLTGENGPRTWEISESMLTMSLTSADHQAEPLPASGPVADKDRSAGQQSLVLAWLALSTTVPMQEDRCCARTTSRPAT